MQYREGNAVFSLSGHLWIGRIAMYCVAVITVAILLHWNSIAAFGATSSQLDPVSLAVETVTTDPDGKAEAVHGVSGCRSCDRDEGASSGHARTCGGCCSFTGCGGLTTAAATIADHPERLAQFPFAARTAPRNLLLPPITRPPISRPGS